MADRLPIEELRKKERELGVSGQSSEEVRNEIEKEEEHLKREHE